MRRRLFHVTMLVAAFVISSGIAACEDLQYLVVSRDVVMGRLKDAPKGNSDRASELENMFREAGCQPIEQAVKGLHEPNVLCLLPGSSNSVIVVGGHLDHVEHGDGTVDDWSGASMLPSLYQTLAGQRRTHSFLFLGFSGEEEGLVGSDYYAKHLRVDQRKQIAAMVNLECLGLTPTKVWTSHSDELLVRMLVAMAQWSHSPLAGVNVEGVGTTDSESFARYKIPRITIHSLTQENLTLLHSKDDNFKAIKPGLYYDSYRLIASYLVLLDQQLPTSPTAAH